MKSRRQFLTLLSATAFVLSAGPTLAQQSVVFTKKGLAIGGYDPVAYFLEAKPVKGMAEFTSLHDGANFQFSSAANKALFDADPGSYAPQYGGYCAYAVANGYTAKTEPDAWSIHDGKLYLNYSKGVRRTWKKDIPGYISKADTNWPGVLK